jgi:hydroxyacylglutathione hydrolase
VLADTRDKFAFAGGHIKGAINIPAGRMFSTWAGWLLPYDKPLILLAPRRTRSRRSCAN